MEIHLKIKRSKKELEALENQEKEVSENEWGRKNMIRWIQHCQPMTKGKKCPSQLSTREPARSPEQKRRKHHHQQPQQHNSWAGSSRCMYFQWVLKLRTKHEMFYCFHFYINTCSLSTGRWIKSVKDLVLELNLSRYVQSFISLLNFVVLVCLFKYFHCTCVFSRRRRRSLSFGTTPPTNKLYARPCLHGSKNWSDLIWTHPHFNIWIFSDVCLLAIRNPCDCLCLEPVSYAEIILDDTTGIQLKRWMLYRKCILIIFMILSMFYVWPVCRIRDSCLSCHTGHSCIWF